jgi:hypothetical protein
MPDINDYFATEALRMEGEIAEVGRYVSPISTVMEKGVAPDGMGFNYQSIVNERTTPSDYTWQELQANDGSGNTCVPTPSTILPARSIKDWSLEQIAFNSNQICIEDIRRSYNRQQQAEGDRDNFRNNIIDVWEQKDRSEYVRWSRWKYVLAPGLPYTDQSELFPAVEATSPLTAQALRTVRNRIIRDGGGKRGSYAKQDGAPVFLVFMSSEQQEGILLRDTEVRQDYRWADPKALLAPFGMNRTYQGWYHMIDDKMPRYDFVDGEWVERPFYTNQATTIGNSAELSSAYESAGFEDVIVWHPEVVKRMVPRPMATGGAGTTFDPINYAGEIRWVNFPSDSTEYRNVDGNTGYFRARLTAGYRPAVTRYGYTLRVKRCNNAMWGLISCSG